jgi:colanic acid/amylovoran biosynthesis glycosyltransferase
VITQDLQNMNLFPFDTVFCEAAHYSTVHKYLYQRYRAVFGYPQGFARKLIERYKVKLLHAHFGTEGVFNLKLKNTTDLPMITTFYGVDISAIPKKQRWLRKYKQLFAKGDLFLVEGTCMKSELVKLGCPDKKLLIQHLGVEIDKFEFRPRSLSGLGKITILISGSFREKKGIPFAIEAFAIAKKKHPAIRLRILGNGELWNQIVLLIEKLGLSDSVDLLGYQPHLVFLKELYDAQIFMQPSITAKNGDTEGGVPVSLLEAQATGLPVISSYHADIPEAVVEEKSALLAPEKDVAVLARHLEYLIEHPEVWKEMGIVGRQHVEENYSLRNQVAKLEDIYDSIIYR